ncbi:serine/threonine protein kinase [Alloscardovia theropitheci]|uniref:non-specific serine/threonine protein kinase n=1 Tax=Alloscardovia theropitheci TaxID=2496842 RepID=A0A4V2MU53_9BIFI|nr:serine/threonine-protein kinase [Alloscardovia theropitheci]TCD55009.1 serine/threonine protein kinase [Alloscardovia theropitheci]
MAQLGSIVGKRYRIATLIGAGGMSTVYLAIDQTLNKQWAIKEIRLLGDAQERDVVMRSLTTEANLIKKFDHPAIPRIVDLFEESGRLYVVMDYVEGRTLADILKTEGVQSEQDVVNWGIQLCDILEYLHQRSPQVIYRDVKPSNIMLTPSGNIKLIDFGIAREVQTEHIQTTVGDSRRLGTVGFAAPEQLDYNAQYDERVDIYSLGATMYYLLTASHPRNNGFSPLRQFNPEFSVGLEEIILKATATDPDKRYESQSHMAYALRHYKEQDDAHQLALKKTYRKFLTVVIATAITAGLSIASFGISAFVANSDYNYWISKGNQTTNQTVAADAYVRASRIRPSSIEPFELLLKLYISDQSLSSQEEHQLNTAINENSQKLKSNPVDWAQLSYDIGNTYWYYFDGFNDEYKGARFVTEQARSARIRAAEPWMRNAAGISEFDKHDLAEVYADIAVFNSQIVPLIAQGTDSGKYKPYFARLQKILKIAQHSNNVVIKFDVANLVINAVTVYGRNFHADGVKKDTMDELTKATFQLVEKTRTSTVTQDEQRKSILDNKETTLDLVNRAYTNENEAQ